MEIIQLNSSLIEYRLLPADQPRACKPDDQNGQRAQHGEPESYAANQRSMCFHARTLARSAEQIPSPVGLIFSCVVGMT